MSGKGILASICYDPQSLLLEVGYIRFSENGERDLYLRDVLFRQTYKDLMDFTQMLIHQGFSTKCEILTGLESMM